MLDKNNRIITHDRKFQCMVGIVDIIRCEYRQAGNRRKHLFITLRMLCGKLPADTLGKAYHHRQGNLPCAHITVFRHMVDDLIEGQKTEIGCHDLRNRTQTADSHAYRISDNGKFGNRGVNKTSFAVFGDQSFRDPVTAAVESYIFTQYHNGFIHFHGFVDSFVQCLTIQHGFSFQQKYLHRVRQAPVPLPMQRKRPLRPHSPVHVSARPLWHQM